ncbi:Signal recognition particle subunit SRP68 [Spathaspora sp. JA1]|nr:Signal recognition particle subunit SRP68 [Spathaspora sp. JA1]
MDSPLNTTIGARMSAYLLTAEDYRKQRKRVNRRLYKLRHELGLITQDTKNYQTKQKLTKVNQDDYNSNDKYGLVWLLTAERDILYALEIKSLLDISSSENEKAGKYKTLMVSKIKRALQHGYKVLELIGNNTENYIQVIELYIYTALIQGQLNVIKKQWDKALSIFSIAKCGLDFLYVQESKEDEEEGQFAKTLINELLDNLVDPSLNLAISQTDIDFVGDLKTISRKYCHEDVGVLSNLIKLIESKDPEFVSDVSSSITLIKEINWRDHQAQIYNDEIAYKIMKLTENQDWTGFTEANQFDVVITGWTDVLELHKLDTEKNQQDDDFEQIQHRAIFLTFINYNLLFTRLKRDLSLIDELRESSKKIEINRDIIRLYNGIIQIVEEIKELPGVFNDEDLSYSLENLQVLFQTKKDIVIGETYQYRELFQEALAIYNYVNQKFSSEQEFYKVEFPFNISTNEEIVELKQELEKKTLQSHISAQFSNSQKNASKFVIENINKFPATSELSDIINLKQVQPIATKPVLFDIGFNYISYDLKQGDLLAINRNVSEEGGQEIEEVEKKKAGFFGGIFGR